jgi:hypothetical protein
VGKSGSYQGGPRVVATVVAALGEIQAIDVRQLGGALTAGQEWQLVQASGRIDRVTRVGVRWRADLLVAGRSVAVLGEPAAGIPAASVLPGRMAVVVGIVRRSTSDSGEFELLPRSSIDFRLGPALAASPTQRGGATPHSSAGMVLTARQNIASLPGSLGQTVVVSGLVVDSESGAATVDDGTGRVRIGGSAAAEAISLLEPGDAIEVGGLVQQDSAGWFIAADPASIVALAAIGDSESSAATISPQPADRARTMEPAPRASSSPALAVTLGMAFALAAGLVAAYSVHRSGRRIHRPALLGGRRLGRGGPASGSGGTI